MSCERQSLIAICTLTIILSVISAAGLIKMVHGLFKKNQKITKYFKITMICCGATNLLICLVITAANIDALMAPKSQNVSDISLHLAGGFLWLITKTSLFFMFHGKLYWPFVGSLFEYKRLYFRIFNAAFLMVVLFCIIYTFYSRITDNMPLSSKGFGFNIFRLVNAIFTILLLIVLNQRLYKLSAMEQTASSSNLELQITPNLNSICEYQTEAKVKEEEESVNEVSSTTRDVSTVDILTIMPSDYASNKSFVERDVFMDLLIKNSLLWFIIILSSIVNGLVWIIAVNVFGNKVIVVSICSLTTAIDSTLDTLCILLSCPICSDHYNKLCKCNDNNGDGCHQCCGSLCVRCVEVCA